MSTGDLASRGIMRCDSGYYIIRQPMPYPLGETNVFLIESGDGWVVIDVGVDLPSTRHIWEQAVKELGISFKQIQRIYVTHCHPDHLGAARWLQQCCEAPVYMLREEIVRAQKYVFLDDHDFRNLYRQAINSEMKINQFPEIKTNELIEDWYAEVRPLYLEPAEILPLEASDKVDLLGETFLVMPAPGHSDGQFMFWGPRNRHLISADLLAASAYLHFTDWPNTRLENPLGEFLAVLEKLKGMDVARTFPGHGPIIEDLAGQIGKLERKHQRILDKVEMAIQAPISAGELYPHMYELIDYVHLHRVVMGETLGYLNHLTDQRRLQREWAGDNILYLPCK